MHICASDVPITQTQVFPLFSFQSCAACKKAITTGSLAIFSDVTDCAWHPDCFRCDECDELLAELIHCYDDGAVFCVRHFGELEYQRCNGCDQVWRSKR